MKRRVHRVEGEAESDTIIVSPPEQQQNRDAKESLVGAGVLRWCAALLRSVAAHDTVASMRNSISPVRRAVLRWRRHRCATIIVLSLLLFLLLPAVITALLVVLYCHESDTADHAGRGATTSDRAAPHCRSLHRSFSTLWQSTSWMTTMMSVRDAPATCVTPRSGRPQNRSAASPSTSPSLLFSSMEEVLHRDSTVLVLFDNFSTGDAEVEATVPQRPNRRRQWRFIDPATPSLTAPWDQEETAEGQQQPFGLTRPVLQRLFSYIAAAFVADRRPPQTPSPPHGREEEEEDDDEAQNPFLTVFPRQRATLWELSQTPNCSGSSCRLQCRPLKIDIVYTYVAPAAVSHHQHMQSYIRQRQAAGDTDTEALLRSARDARHFRDWDELRYSLRSVEQYLYRSPFMQVRDDMLHADAIMLREEFGLEVAVELQRSTDGEDVLHGNSSSHVGSAIHSLLGVVYIVVAADDQLPSWLRTSPLGGFVRVVRHAVQGSREMDVTSPRRAAPLPMQQEVRRCRARATARPVTTAVVRSAFSAAVSSRRCISPRVSPAPQTPLQILWRRMRSHWSTTTSKT